MASRRKHGNERKRLTNYGKQAKVPIYPQKNERNTMDRIMETLDGVKRFSKNGGEYWMGRDIQAILGYDKWENFKKVIEKAREGCKSAGAEPKYHFLDTGKMVLIGSGAQREKEDCFLTRYACYLIAMNGDASKPEIGSAQTYFAIQTRRQEVSDLSLNDEKRLELRDRVKVAVKHLNSAAKNSGVVNYAFFQDAGYRGLYGMGLKAIKAKKGIPQKDDLMDRSGRAELAANEFRYTQTEQRLKREPVRDGDRAERVHNEVGRKVRQTIRDIGGTLPEELPAEPSIKKLAQAKKKLLRGSSPAAM
jgi:DNA-damage-inducible protein D